MDNNELLVTDWGCLECDSRGSRSSDCNIDTEAKKLRFMELCGLGCLPYRNEAQTKRYNKLLKLKKRDNTRIKRQLMAGARLQSY